MRMRKKICQNLEWNEKEDEPESGENEEEDEPKFGENEKEVEPESGENDGGSLELPGGRFPSYN